MNNRDNRKITLLYFVGAGNSGSTIFSMALGAHPQITSIGELSHINKYITENKECSCGKVFNQCSFWSSINLKDSSRLTPMAGFWPLFFKTWELQKFSILDKELLENNDTVYNRISQQTGSNIIIDASKDMRRLFYLSQSKKVNIIPIFLVRDGRAYVDSFLRRGGGSAMKGLLRWARMNLQTIVSLYRIGLLKKSIRVGFKSFSANPEETIKEICKTIDITYSAETLEYYNHTSHNIAGTRTRFNLKPIKVMEGWRKRLTKLDLLTYYFLGGWLMNYYFGANRDISTPK